MPKQREHLVIGCGHSYFCTFSHPASKFETIDIDPQMKPDVVLDITNVETFSQQYHDQKFSAIIFEYLYEEKNKINFFDYLKENGNLVYVGGFFLALIHVLDLGATLCMFYSDSGDFHPVSIIPKDGQLNIDPLLQNYLNDTLANKHCQKCEIKITPELKQRAGLLKAVHYDIARKRPYFPDSFIIAALLATPNKEPITANHIRQITESYSPGWLRRHTIGKTKGMVELETFLSRYVDAAVLEEKDIGELIRLMQDRQRRVINSLNPARDVYGSTTQVYKQIVVAILNFWLSNAIHPMPVEDPKNENKL